MKKLVATLIILSSLFALCAEDSKKEDKTFYQINTKYFQIIYQQKSLETATLLYENADQLYEDIAKKLNTETNLSIPVLIRSDIQALNAYFTSYPYNRIVLYDTIPDGQSLAVFSDTILSVFYHELVHAVTLNMKNKTWRFIGNIFGDFFSPTIISSPTVFSEGATVSFESATGEGRLNSGYAKNILVQAKLENKLPDWKEASGANDKYRVGDYPYIFGGAFHQFLQEKYGMEKYSELWKTLGSKDALTEPLFKQVYGKKLKVVWAEFLDTIPTLPVVEVNQTNLTKKDNITCFTTVNNTTIYYSKDDKAIYSLKDGKQKKILTTTSVADLSLSDDERFLAITKLNPEMQYETYVYDLQKKSYLKGYLASFRLPCFATQNDKLVLLGLTSAQNKTSIQYYEIDEKTVLKTSDFSNQTLIEDDNWVTFSDIEIYEIEQIPNQNSFAILAKDKLDWFVAEIDFDKLEMVNYAEDFSFFQKTYKFPENIIPLSLSSVSTNEYLISYVEKDYSLSRIAKIVDGKLYCQQENILGGIQNPVKISDGYIFLNKMLKYNTLSTIQKIPGDFSSPIDLEDVSESENLNLGVAVEDVRQMNNYLASTENPEATLTSIPLDAKYQSVIGESKKYSGMRFLNQTAIVPLISYFDLTGKNLFTENSALALPGLTILWQNPLENRLVGFGFGYSKKMMNSHISFSNPEKFSFVLTGVWDNEDETGFEFSESNLSMNFFGSIDLTKSDLSFIYNYDLLYYIPTSLEWIRYYRLQLALSGLYGSIGTSYSYERNYLENNYLGIGCFASLILPRLLPFNSPYGFTLNLPLTANVSLPGDFSTFFAGDAELTLFSAEIHKSVPLIPFYTNRFSITSKYFFMYSYKSYDIIFENNFIEMFADLSNKTDLVHGITASAFFELTPVIGNLVNLRTRLGVDLTYYLGQEDSLGYNPCEITIAGMFTF